MTGVLVFALVLTGTGADGGDLLMRLGRRFPQSLGNLEGAWAGDGFEFLHRARITVGDFHLTLVAEKDRGEDWCDLIAAGAAYSPSDGRTFTAVAGWMRAELGSGLILSHPSGWGGASGVEAKPPGLNSRIEPAASPGCSDSEPLTGAGAEFHISGMTGFVLGSSSRLDPSGEGLHRSEAELEAARSVEENLAGFRLAGGAWGLDAALSEDDRGDWARAGIDFDGSIGGLGLSAEAAFGSEDGSGSRAAWVCFHEQFDDLRFCAGAFSFPEDFPARRSALPIGGTGDIGAGAAVGWRPGGGWSADFSANSVLIDEESRTGAELALEKRMTSAFDLGTRGRWSSGMDESSYRLVGSSSWRPAGGIILSSAVQKTGAGGEGGDSGGAGAEARLKLVLSGDVSLRFSAAGFSTDDYDSRVYFGELSFPGDFASVQQWGDGVYLQAAAGFPLGASEISARVGYLRKDRVVSLGEGMEQTEGPSRVDATLQFETVLR